MKTDTKINTLQTTSTPRTGKSYRTPVMEAARLFCSLRTIRTKIRNREIPFYRFGHKILLVPDEVDAVLAANRQRAYSEPKRAAGRITAPAEA